MALVEQFTVSRHGRLRVEALTRPGLRIVEALLPGRAANLGRADVHHDEPGRRGEHLCRLFRCHLGDP
jgi:hypothetical protein